MLGVVVLALLGVMGVIGAIQRVFYAPDGPVKQLFAALAERDTAKAAQLANCVAQPLCQGAALRTGYNPPTEVTIAGVTYGDPTDQTRRPDKNVAVVQVRFRLAGQTRSSTVEVRRQGSGLFRPWRVSGGATGYLDVVSAYTPAAQVAGARVKTLPEARTVAGTGGAVQALPGLYTVTAAADDPIFTAKPATVAVFGQVSHRDSPPSVQLDLAVKPTAATEVDRQVRQRITDCTGRPEIASHGCPFSVPGIVISPADVRWAVLDQPQIELRLSGDPAADGGPVKVRTVVKGHASVTYTAVVSAGGARATMTAVVDINVSGVVGLDDAGQVVWSG